MAIQNKFHEHPHWPAVARALAAIEAHGFEALLAGGCVRDLIMGREPNDFDIATNATPEDLRKFFPQALEVGREFGVTILPEDGFQLELATFRKDGPYLDGRRPSSIEFSNAEEDAKRRDFTVNALFYNVATSEILDFVGGQADIQTKVIRTVGDPFLRFEEDKLRLLRAARFAAQLNFEVAPETLKAICDLHASLSVVSKERVHDEILKLLKAPQRSFGLKILRDTGLLWDVVPSYPKEEDLKSAFENLKAAPALTPTEVLLALFLKPLGAVSSIKAQLKELKFSAQEISAVVWLLENEPVFLNPAHTRLALKIKTLAHPLSTSLERLCSVQELASQGQTDSKRSDHLNNVRKEYLIDYKTLPERFIDGGDLKSLGFAPGPQMGQVLEEAYNLQLEKTLQSKEQVIEWVQKRQSLN